MRPLTTGNKVGQKAPPPTRMDLDRKKIENEQLNIERDTKALNKKLKALRKNGGQTDLVELKYLNRLVRRLIPMAAEVFATYKNDRAAKSLEILMNQKREILLDMRALDSGPKHIKFVQDRVLSPALQAVMQGYLSEAFEMRKALRKIKDVKQRELILKALSLSMKNFGQLFDAIQEGTDGKLQEYFAGKTK